MKTHFWGRCISVLLIFALLFTMMPTMAFAATHDYEGENIVIENESDETSAVDKVHHAMDEFLAKYQITSEMSKEEISDVVKAMDAETLDEAWKEANAIKKQMEALSDEELEELDSNQCTEGYYTVYKALEERKETVVNSIAASDNAQFTVGGNTYGNLNAAVSAAQQSSNKTIVLANNGTLPAGDYVIPTGITLLIPFDSAKHFAAASMERGGDSPVGNVSFVKMEKAATCTEDGNYDAVVKWTKVSNVKYYQVYISKSKSFSSSKVVKTTGTSYTHKTATKGRTYYYKVKVTLKTGQTKTSSYVKNTSRK